MDSREQRIANLATTLRASGIARSDAQAKMMAEDMIGVEDKVQRSYEERHADAHDHLETTKHLGNPRIVNHANNVGIINPTPERRVEQPRPQPVPAQKIESDNYPTLNTNPNTAANAAASSHNTGNSLLEAIKAQVSKEHIVPLYDQYMQKEAEREAALKPQQPPVSSPISHEDHHEQLHPSVTAQIEVVDIPESPATEGTRIIEEISADPKTQEPVVLVEQIKVVSEPVISKIEIVDMPHEESSPELQSESAPEPQQQVLKQEEVQEEMQEEDPKLDAQKLVELMEEDGKLEEHTREIKSKPENAKPRESYVENSIDLSDMFRFKK